MEVDVTVINSMNNLYSHRLKAPGSVHKHVIVYFSIFSDRDEIWIHSSLINFHAYSHRPYINQNLKGHHSFKWTFCEETYYSMKLYLFLFTTKMSLKNVPKHEITIKRWLIVNTKIIHQNNNQRPTCWNKSNNTQ